MHAATRVRDDEGLGTESVHYPNRKGDRVQGIALVAMKAALHGDDRSAAQAAQQQPAGMTLDGGEGKPGNSLVRERGLDFDTLGQLPQAGTQNDCDRRLQCGDLANCVHRRADLVEQGNRSHPWARPGTVSSLEPDVPGRTRRCSPSTSPRCRSSRVRKLATYAVNWRATPSARSRTNASS